MNRNQMQIGPGLRILGLAFGGLVMMGGVYVGAVVVGLGPVGVEPLLLAALGSLGLSLAVGAVSGATRGGVRALVGLAGQGAHIWILKSILAASWASAALVWLVGLATSLLVAFSVAAVLAGLVGAAVRSRDQGPPWREEPSAGQYASELAEFRARRLVDHDEPQGYLYN